MKLTRSTTALVTKPCAINREPSCTSTSKINFNPLLPVTLADALIPIVMIVGNNSAWGLEKHPMQSLFGYDVAADLGHQTRYDQVAIALDAGGEFVTDPSKIGAALDRAFASGIPCLVNIATDPAIAYPRTTTGS